ncbi:MAG: nicotinate phosphoribosyltransferase [Candidatus Infernicultor aquiphilus]|uniref:Nicotinate phosphoribosyltransferase n=1 Tax=Candidatus Infernicultor aquiphilus TaxID=1805029 RepID=A0A1J5H1F7_9BACT|nr:nicotinate phosphoribosyltransferase [bacterium]OIP74695.1 MAG: nicotinate phosphoribosyltransferase [Candidatus Atribacteria bacterium CG2_30_33_13]PIW12225.1 MAG: nicotinate phosphoribosyltransferase [Candidatus Atribacteria bacterium CG17_big_fil_post_rev_8_21_14_2_50_34_11]PIX34411.1 MAG: nicotinate phosphoribosyltransferase [Candidatus Atribacteria bacterium CG_4_8_14_3_um_filter_34_18]PIY32218.1 MAG: nicotinate phosphoribosyltransferase [Candidatus Atribacteria bacterium CG_4_10_14_3_u
MKESISSIIEIENYSIKQDRKFFSATHEEIEKGLTTDIYFVRAQEILRYLRLENTIVTAEIFPRGGGIFAGTEEVYNLLKDKKIKLWALEEGVRFQFKDTVMRIEGPYCEFGVFETVILGILASSSAWATAARECKDAASDKKVLCFGSRHIHPAVAPVMERAAIIGGVDGASCILGAKLSGEKPQGTIPHTVIIISGDTIKAAQAFNICMPKDVPRIILIDTFKDEAEESIRVAGALGRDLLGVRLDTPSERGGVTPDLVKEVRIRLNQAGFSEVKIFVSGGLTPERINLLSKEQVDAFGVGSYISDASPIDMTLDIKEVEGKPIAKRGRIPGKIENLKLKRIM